MEGIDSGYAWVKRRLCLARASRLGGLYPVVAVGADVVFPQGVYYHQDYVQNRTASIDMLSRLSVAAADYTARPGRYRNALSAADTEPTPSSLQRRRGVPRGQVRLYLW